MKFKVGDYVESRSYEEREDLRSHATVTLPERQRKFNGGKHLLFVESISSIKNYYECRPIFDYTDWSNQCGFYRIDYLEKYYKLANKYMRKIKLKTLINNEI